MGHGRTELFEVIREVRNRWRRRLLARGAVIVLGGTIVALLLSAHGLETLRFSAAAIISFRVMALAVFAALVAYGIVMPLRRRHRLQWSQGQLARGRRACDTVGGTTLAGGGSG